MNNGMMNGMGAVGNIGPAGNMGKGVMNVNQMMDGVPGAGQDGINAGVGVGDLRVLNDTDIGVLRKKKDVDKSTYTRTTKPDGTVVEKVKMRKDNTSTGLVDLGTQGVDLDGVGVKAGVGEESQQHAVEFVDSIWGSRTAAAAGAENKKLELQNQQEELELEKFRAIRQMNIEEEQRKALAAAQEQQGEGVSL